MKTDDAYMGHWTGSCVVQLWLVTHDDVIKWKHFQRYWPFVPGINQWPVNSPAQRPVIRSFVVFLYLNPNEWLRKQSRGWWSEMPSCSLWRHCNVFHLSHHLKQWVSQNRTWVAIDINFSFHSVHNILKYISPINNGYYSMINTLSMPFSLPGYNIVSLMFCKIAHLTQKIYGLS